MKEEKCIVCLKPFNVIQSRASRKYKVGRQSNRRGNYTCSPKCARIYGALYKHFQYRLKKKIEEQFFHHLPYALTYGIVNDVSEKEMEKVKELLMKFGENKK